VSTGVTVIGGGLAGVEAAWAGAMRGVRVRLFEMRPAVGTPAHKTGKLAELVCSNSFKSDLPTTPSGQLKREMERLGSLVIAAARECSVSAGEALAVDREQFADLVTARIEGCDTIELIRREVADWPREGPTVIATGPLTSDALSRSIAAVTGREHLHFYDAVSPAVEGSTVDREASFAQSRYDKGGEDYINCPLDEQTYDAFVDFLLSAERAPLHEFEKIQYFEGCLPIEEIARRGRMSLAFSNLKPVGLTDPRTGDRPFAAIQLRPENRAGTLYGLVGCQTRLKWGEQKKLFRMVPGLAEAEFVRFGVVHRNTYIDSPRLLFPTLQLRRDEAVLFAGQLVGVEGYVESAASGIVAGINAARLAIGLGPVIPPPQTVIGSLLDYVATCPAKQFVPMNANWGLLPEPHPPIRPKQQRRSVQLATASAAIEAFAAETAPEHRRG
jgi:methylenetetrahydrofolate--tRNA-(uracil-5-)-methyltransferase